MISSDKKKHTAAFGMADACGCFDQILHTVAILVLLSFGLCSEHARILFEVLQLAEHRIKTGFGVSDHVYGIGDDIPLMGVGQGNGNGMCVWTLISSKMIEVMKKRGHGVNLQSSLSLSIISIIYFAFVDDTDLPMSAPTRNTKG